MDILHQVKEHTAGSHAHFEERLGRHLFTSTLAPEQYSSVLSAFYRAYKTLETVLLASKLVPDLLPNRAKSIRLRQDLDGLRRAIPDALDLGQVPAPATRGYALGMMYVMEGATLGGKYIAHQLGKYDWISAERNLNFFNSYGEQRAIMWKEFTNIVENYAESHPQESKDILEGAEATFRFMDTVISQL